MLHTTSQGHWPFGPRKEDIKRVFTIYGHGGNLGHVTSTIGINFGKPIIRSFHVKFDFNWSSGF